MICVRYFHEISQNDFDLCIPFKIMQLSKSFIYFYVFVMDIFPKYDVEKRTSIYVFSIVLCYESIKHFQLIYNLFYKFYVLLRRAFCTSTLLVTFI